MNINFGLSVYGSQKVIFTKILDKSETDSRLKEILKGAFKHKAELSSKDSIWKPLAKKGPFSKVLAKFDHGNTGYGFYCFKNDSDKTIEIQLSMTKQLNVQFCKFNSFLIFF